MPSPADRDDDPFLLTSELEIRSVLRSIQRSASLLRMYMRGDSDQSIMTTVLDLDDANQRLIVDSSSADALNDRLIKAPAVLFDTQVNHVSIHFMGTDLESCTYDGLPALSLPYPTELRRLQRREFYRVEIPMGEPVSCIIPITERGAPPRHVDARIKDISVGGLALLDMDSQLPHQSGLTFKDVRLSLPEAGEATVDLLVLRVHTQVLPNKKEVVELGCKFAGITNATTMLIQNYIGRLERRLIAKQRGY